MPFIRLNHELRTVSWTELYPSLAASQNQLQKRERDAEHNLTAGALSKGLKNVQIIEATQK